MSDYVPSIDDLRVKLCYICREEERFDDPDRDTTRQWTHPCNCTLVAHEDCLLHWIQTASGSNARKCPQCGTEYELESDNPMLLRVLERGQRAVIWGGRAVALLGSVTFVGSTAVSMVRMLAKYGAFAARQFIGEQAFRLLVPDDPSKWPLSAWLNLPLVPITLIMSGFDSKFGLWAPLHLVIDIVCNSPHSLSLLYHPDATSNSITSFEDGNILTTWPPPPLFFTLCALPVGRILYRRAYRTILSKIIGTGRFQADTPEELLLNLRFPVDDPPEADQELPAPPNQAVEAAPVVPPNREEQRGPEGQREQEGQVLDAQLRREGQDEQQERVEQQREVPADRQPLDAGAHIPAPAVAPAPAPPAPVPAPLPANDGDNGDRLVITLSLFNIFRRIGAALALPVISNQLGKLLLHLSRYSTLLRRFLAPRPTPPEFPAYTATSFRGTAARWRFPEGMSFWDGMKTSLRVLAGTGSPRRDLAGLDPVWWRNTVGLGIFVFVKDAFYLIHLYLAKKELDSVQVKNRDFREVDRNTLDLVPGWPGAVASNSTADENRQEQKP